MLMSILTERTVDDGEGMISLHVIDVGDSENRAKSSRFHNHRPRFGRGARRGLRERRRHGGVKSDVAFHFLHRLMNVSVQDRDRSESSEKTKRLFGVVGPPTPLRINRP